MILLTLFQNKYPEFLRSRLRVTSYNALGPPMISINGVHFLTSDWTFTNINVNVANSDTSLLTLTVQATIADGSNETHPYNVGFNNCTLGNWVLSNINNITILDSKVINVKYKEGNFPLEILQSTFLIKNLVVEGCSADKSLITLAGSHGIISGSKFTQNRAEALVSALTHSSLTLEGSDFTENTVRVNRGVVVVNNCTCEVQNSSFENNTEGAIRVENYASLKVTFSVFIGNRAETGGAILGSGHVEISISNAAFLSNKAVSLLKSPLSYTEYKPTEMQPEIHQNSTERFLTSTRSTLNQDRKASSKTVFEANNETAVRFESQNAQKASPLLKAERVSRIMSQFLMNSNTSSFSAKPFSSLIKNYGGAIACDYFCVIAISDSSFTENSAGSIGGAIAAYSASLILIASTLVSNSAQDKGGAIATELGGAVNVRNSTFMNNSAQSSGGAVSVSFGGSLEVDRTVFLQNSAQTHGGAVMLMSDSVAVFTNTTFLHNKAGHGGGGILTNQMCTLTLLSNLFLSNNGEKGGALHAVNYGNISVDDSKFINNTTPIGNGGAIRGYNSIHFEVSNSYYANNTAGLNGGAFSLQIKCSANLSNVIFSQNGGVAAMNAEKECKVRITECLFQRNFAAIKLLTDCTVTVSNSRFIQNEAQIDHIGGAITGQSVNVSIYNSTFEGQTSRQKGGALYFEWSTHVTIIELHLQKQLCIHEGWRHIRLSTRRHHDGKTLSLLTTEP